MMKITTRPACGLDLVAVFLIKTGRLDKRSSGPHSSLVPM